MYNRIIQRIKPMLSAKLFAEKTLNTLVVSGDRKIFRRKLSTTVGKKLEEGKDRERLHSKLEDFMHSRNQDITDDKIQRPVYKIFFENLAKNKPQIINIGAAFVCTILAYQILAFKRGKIALEKKVNLIKTELEKKQLLLGSLTESSFTEGIARECHDEVIKSSTVGNGWIRLKQTQSEVEIATMQSIIIKALQKKIGNAALSDDQKKDQIVSKLQEARIDLVTTTQSNNSDKVEIIIDPSGSKVVKRTKFSI